MRNAECTGERRTANDLALQFRIPYFTFRIVGGANAGAPHRGVPHRALLYIGRPVGRGGGGLVRLSRVRAARGALLGEVSRARRRAPVPRRAGGPLPFLSDREPRRAPGRGELDDTRGPAQRDRGLPPLSRRGL